MQRILPLAALLLLAAAGSAIARQGTAPYSLRHPDRVGTPDLVPAIVLPAIDAARVRAGYDARARARTGPHPKRLAIAKGDAVDVRPERDGVWEVLPDGSSLWRMRVSAPGATDLHPGFLRYALPADATLYVIGAGGYYQGPYTEADAIAGQFWAPVVPGDTAMLELRLPAGRTLPDGALRLGYVGAGFRDLFRRQKDSGDTGPGTSEACEIDVVCPLGQIYPDQIRAVGEYEFRGTDDQGQPATFLCTGTLLDDIPQDRRNYFLSAAHCVSTATAAVSVVVYWNYQSLDCQTLVEPPAGYYADSQSGASLRATRADADFTLLELSQAPDPAWRVYYAGWDASGMAPSGSITLHHPSGDVKKISRNLIPLSTTDNCIDTGGTSIDTHWLVGPYSQGVTEGGSSGSGLFVPADGGSGHDRLLIGSLSGGNSACTTATPSAPNNQQDCYGKFSVAWYGPGAASRLRDWLDPANTGALTVSGLDSTTPTPDPALATEIAAEKAAQWAHAHHGIEPPPLPFDTRTRVRQR